MNALWDINADACWTAETYKNVQNWHFGENLDFQKKLVLPKWSNSVLFQLAADQCWRASRGRGTSPSQNRKNPKLFQYVRFRPWSWSQIGNNLSLWVRFRPQTYFYVDENFTPAATLVLSLCCGSISFQIGVGDQWCQLRNQHKMCWILSYPNYIAQRMNVTGTLYSGWDACWLDCDDHGCRSQVRTTWM